MHDLSSVGAAIKQRRTALGISQQRLSHLSGLSRQTLNGLENGSLNDLGFNRVVRVLNVLGLDSPAPTTSARLRKKGLWMAAKTASVSYQRELDADTLASTLATGKVPDQYIAHLSHLFDEAPLPTLVMAVEEAARAKHVAPAQVWKNVTRLVRALGSVRSKELT